MKTLLAQPQIFFGRSNVLRGGRAPVNWKSELAREATRVGEAFRASEWLPEIAEVRPSFFDQPLFGACLAQITGSELREPDQKNTEALKTEARFDPPDVMTRRSKFRAAPNGSQLSEHTGGPVSQLPACARASLLERFAPLEDVSQVRQQDGPLQMSSSPERVASSSPSSSPPPIQHNDYLQVAADRTRKRLNTPTITSRPTGVAVPMPQADFGSPPAQRFAEKFGAPLPFREQWTISLDGQKAPREILDHIVRVARPGFGRPAVARHSRGASQLPDDRSRKSIEPRQTKVDAITRNNPTSHSDTSRIKRRSKDRETSPTRINEIEAARESEAPRDIHYETFTDRDPERTTSEDHASPFVRARGSQTRDELRIPAATFAPPALTATLPPLLPAASPGDPVLPLAARTARDGAWRSEINEQEKDLSFLAAQIKRILDEEARRHGIDV